MKITAQASVEGRCVWAGDARDGYVWDNNLWRHSLRAKS